MIKMTELEQKRFVDEVNKLRRDLTMQQQRFFGLGRLFEGGVEETQMDVWKDYGSRF